MIKFRSAGESLGIAQVYQYGFQQRASYHQSVKSSDVISIAYSPFSGDFALLDGAGITHWNKDTQIGMRGITSFKINHSIFYALKFNFKY